MKKKLISLLVILTLASCNQNKNTNNNISVSAETDTLNKSANLLPPRTRSQCENHRSYARQVARDAYFWAWPMENIYNRRLAFKQAPKVGLMNRSLPFAPLNSLAMLHDYIKPEQRWVACPNQDVVYGAAIAALDETPVIVQVPDFGDRFWVYQVVDLRTDSFAQLGKMYETKPGFYLLVGPKTGKVTFLKELQ